MPPERKKEIEEWIDSQGSWVRTAKWLRECLNEITKLTAYIDRAGMYENERLRGEIERLRDVIAAIAAPINAEDYGNGWATELARKSLKERGDD